MNVLNIFNKNKLYQAMKEFKYQNTLIKASFGTTKYFQNFISKQKCQKQIVYSYTIEILINKFTNMYLINLFRIKFNKGFKFYRKNNQTIF